jgi:hypothetical protein
MTQIRIAAFVSLVLPLLLSATPASPAELRGATLRSYDEVPAISSRAFGLFAASIADDAQSLTFTLIYTDLEGGSVAGAHIHLGQPGVNGGIVVHFCGTGGKPACPASPAALNGTATAADVVAVPAQGIAAGDIESVIRAIREGRAYVNVHTADFGSGEIRGQIR